MNCPNCNELLEGPTREARSTTGSTCRYDCPCGIAFSAYRPAHAKQWRVSLLVSRGKPRRGRVDAGLARRRMMLAAWEDIEFLGRLGVETEQARQLVIKVKGQENANGQELPETKTNSGPGKRQRQWAAGGLNRKPGRRPGGSNGAGRTEGAD